jgi:fatty acid desaturase
MLGAVDLLSRDEIRALTRRSNLAGWYAVVSTWAVIAACFAMLAVWPNVLTFVAVVIVLGGRQLALAVAMHEAAHGTLFTHRWFNERFADWACARPVWSDTARYRKHHLQHHAHTGTERDPDLGLAPVEPMTRRSLARKVVRDLVGATGAKRVIGLLLIDAGLIGYDVGGGSIERKRRGSFGHHVARLAKNFGPTLVANLALYGVLAAFGIGWTYLAWAAAYLTTFSLFVRIRSLAEHACMERTADPLHNTRSTRASWLARLTVAPLHVNYHLEHHLLPTVPWQQLPALAAKLDGNLPPRSQAPDYVAVLRTVSAARA